MKLLFVVDTLFKGGAGRVISELASQFQREGNECTICTFAAPEVTYTPAPGVKHINGFACGRNGRKPSFLTKVGFLRRLLRDGQWPVAISFLTELNVITLLAATGTATKVIISERNNPATDKHNVRDKFLRWLLYRCWADGYVFQTAEIRDWFSAEIVRRSAIIGNPINPQLPEPYSGVRPPRIVMAGRLNQQKNYPMALEAFAQVAPDFPEYTLEIYGEGPLKDELTARIAELHLEGRAILKGHSGSLLQEIRDASLFLLSSDYEGMSNALMEALGLGLAVISTDHEGGGGRALIHSGVNGILTPMRDVSALAAKMRQLLGDPALRETLARNALRIRQEYAIDAIAARWKEYIDRVLA